MSIPRVTIGLPVHNGERTLAETLDSLLSQDFADFELIISDNASTDRTQKIAEEYASRDTRVTYIRNEINRGAAFNYNRLVDLAQGEFFKWSAANDLVDPRLLGQCLPEFDRDPTLVLVYGRTTLIDEGGEPIRDHEDGLNLRQHAPWERMRQFATKRWLCNPIYGLIRTDVLRRTPLIKSYHSADVTLLAQLAFEGRFLELPDRLFQRRVLPSAGLGGWTSKQVAAWFDPRTRAPKIPRTLRVFLDIELWILRSDISLQTRLRTAVAFAYAWHKRQAGITLWRIRRRLRGGGGGSFAKALSMPNR